MNYGFEGFGKDVNGGDTILKKSLLKLLHYLLGTTRDIQNNLIYMDSNNYLDEVELDTNIQYSSFEYCGLTGLGILRPDPVTNYHGNTFSRRKMKKWKN